jgi:hypothetical protein
VFRKMLLMLALQWRPINNIQLTPLSRFQKPDTVAKSRISAAC